MKSELAKARDKWFESDNGRKCCEGYPSGQYLHNRLELAFLAGYDFWVKRLKEITKKEYCRGVKDGLNQAAEVVKNC